MASVSLYVCYFHMPILKLIDVHTGDACTIKFTGRSLVRSLSTSTSRCFILHILSITAAHIVVSVYNSYTQLCTDSHGYTSII